MEIGFDPVIFTQRTYLRTSLTIHSIFYHFLILNQPTNSKYTFYLSLFQLSTHSTLLLLLLLSTRVVWFLVLDYSVHVSKSFQHPTHSKSLNLHFPSFLPKHIFDSHSNPTTLQPFHISTIPSIHPSSKPNIATISLFLSLSNCQIGLDRGNVETSRPTAHQA